MARSFNKRAQTPFFKKKLAVATLIEKTFKEENVRRHQYYTSGFFKDEKRNVVVWLFIGRKVKGVGQGLVNDVELKWGGHHRDKFNWKALTPKEIEVYYKQINTNEKANQ